MTILCFLCQKSGFRKSLFVSIAVWYRFCRSDLNRTAIGVLCLKKFNLENFCCVMFYQSEVHFFEPRVPARSDSGARSRKYAQALHFLRQLPQRFLVQWSAHLLQLSTAPLCRTCVYKCEGLRVWRPIWIAVAKEVHIFSSFIGIRELSAKSSWIINGRKLEMAQMSLVVGLLLTVVTVSMGEDCRVKSLARYNVTFEGRWKRSVFPKQYPLWRPPAKWSAVLGKSCNFNFCRYSC